MGIEKNNKFIVQQNHCKIRKINESEYDVLPHFLYGAIFQREGEELAPFEIIEKPELKVFIEDFGKSDDNCLVAECDGKIVGAVWTRILNGECKGFGNVDSETPEFAISVDKEFQKCGIGTLLMQQMLNLLKEKGYKQTSLAVQKDNYAVSMYKKVGFKIIDELEEEFLMLYKFNENV